MPARPGPKPSGRVNAVKVMLDDDEYSDLQDLKLLLGISSDSEGMRLALSRHVRGALGTLPALAALCGPSQSISLTNNNNNTGGAIGHRV